MIQDPNKGQTTQIKCRESRGASKFLVLLVVADFCVVPARVGGCFKCFMFCKYTFKFLISTLGDFKSSKVILVPKNPN